MRRAKDEREAPEAPSGMESPVPDYREVVHSHDTRRCSQQGDDAIRVVDQVRVEGPSVGRALELHPDRIRRRGGTASNWDIWKARRVWPGAEGNQVVRHRIRESVRKVSDVD